MSVQACHSLDIRTFPGQRRPFERGISDHPVVPVDTTFVFVRDLELAILVEDKRARRHAVGEKNAGCDGGPGTDDGVSPHDGGARVKGHVVFEGGVPLFASERLSSRKGPCDEGYTLEKFAVGSDIADKLSDWAA